MSTNGFEFSADGKTLLNCNFTQLGTSITVPQGCTKIANGVFAEAPVVSVSLPDSITEIGENLFSSCETLEEVKLPSQLTNLKPFTFSGCTSLKKITMPAHVNEFPAGLFWGCASLKEIPFQEGISVLSQDVCRDCESITSAVIPPSVKTIKTGAFAGCKNLSTIVFPEGIETIEDRSLAGLSSLKFMRLSSDCDNFFVDENYGCLYQLTGEGAVLIKCPVNQETIYLIENTCDVHIDAFDSCSALAEVYAYEGAPESLINKLMELIPHIDVNSYGDEAAADDSESYDEPAQYAADSETTRDTDDVSFDADDSDQSDTNASDTAASAKKAPAEPDTDLDIAAILDQNVTHQDDDLEGVLLNMEELDRLFSSKPVDVNSSADTTPEEDGAQNKSTADQAAEESTGDESDSSAGDTDEPAAEETAGSVDIDEILNSQCCRNDALDEGFRPIDPDELDRLFSSAPVSLEEAAQIAASTEPAGAHEQNESTEQTDADLQEDKSEEKPKRKRRTSKKAKEENAQEDGENSENGDSAQLEEKPKRKRRSTKKAKDAAETEDAEVPSAKEPETKAPQTEEPRFLKMMKSLASHQMTLEEDENEVENVYGDLKELFVIADGVAPSTNDFSSHLVKFAKNVAKKYGFTKIYFFEDLPLDNPEFIYGLGSFGNLRNVLYACNKPCTDKIDENQKELIDATGLSMAEKKIHSVKEKIEDETNTKRHYPVKILVQDNYIEGLLYCAEKFREEHGIK